MNVDRRVVDLDKPEDVNIIIGQAHFIKTVEDLYEAIVASVPGIRFGLAFYEASEACLVRSEGTDPEGGVKWRRELLQTIGYKR